MIHQRQHSKYYPTRNKTNIKITPKRLNLENRNLKVNEGKMGFNNILIFEKKFT